MTVFGSDNCVDFGWLYHCARFHLQAGHGVRHLGNTLRVHHVTSITQVTSVAHKSQVHSNTSTQQEEFYSKRYSNIQLGIYKDICEQRLGRYHTPKLRTSTNTPVTSRHRACPASSTLSRQRQGGDTAVERHAAPTACRMTVASVKASGPPYPTRTQPRFDSHLKPAVSHQATKHSITNKCKSSKDNRSSHLKISSSQACRAYPKVKIKTPSCSGTKNTEPVGSPSPHPREPKIPDVAHGPQT